MNKVLIFCLMMTGIFLAAQSDAKLEQASRSKQWVCDAQGVQYSGSNEILQSLSAYGDSESDAANNAQEACIDFGLEQCQVTNCYQQ